MPCAQCQHANRDAARFCAACASPLGATCASCGNQNPSGATFCDTCATPLIVDATAWNRAQARQQELWAERRFHTLLPAIICLLQRDRRVTYRTLKWIFGIDETFLEDVRKELTFTQCAHDEQGVGFVWTGEAHPAVQPRAHASRQQTLADTPAVPSAAAPTLPPRVTGTLTPSHGPQVLTHEETPTALYP